MRAFTLWRAKEVNHVTIAIKVWVDGTLEINDKYQDRISKNYIHEASIGASTANSARFVMTIRSPNCIRTVRMSRTFS